MADIVLILGAGASQPYGFPVGKSLVDAICMEFPARAANFGSGRESSTLRAGAENFCRALHDSGSESIDSFLEYRPDLRMTGRVAITSMLLASEREKGLSNLEKDNEDNWYRRLFNWLAPQSLDAFPFHGIDIVTYNYDRSLEQYLFRAIKGKYGCYDDAAALALKKVPIIHVHGSFGRLPWQAGSASVVPYGDDVDARDKDMFVNASKNINIVFEEGIDSSESLATVRKTFHGSRAIIFMGFGFHEINLRRLEIPRDCPENVTISGTCYGLTVHERNAMINRLHTYCVRTNIDLLPYRNLEFMRNSPWFA